MLYGEIVLENSHYYYYYNLSKSFTNSIEISLYLYNFECLLRHCKLKKNIKTLITIVF